MILLWNRIIPCLNVFIMNKLHFHFLWRQEIELRMYEGREIVLKIVAIGWQLENTDAHTLSILAGFKHCLLYTMYILHVSLPWPDRFRRHEI